MLLVVNLVEAAAIGLIGVLWVTDALRLWMLIVLGPALGGLLVAVTGIRGRSLVIALPSQRSCSARIAGASAERPGVPEPSTSDSPLRRARVSSDTRLPTGGGGRTPGRSATAGQPSRTWAGRLRPGTWSGA